MTDSTRPAPKASVIVRLAKPEDIDQIAQIHSVINRAYRSGKPTAQPSVLSYTTTRKELNENSPKTMK